LSLGGVLTRASEEVEQGSERRQTPYINGPATLQKNFHFAPGSVAVAGAELESEPFEAAEPPSSPAPVREDAETFLWNEVQKGNTAEDYDAYLAQFPKGRYAALAKRRIKNFREATAAETRAKLKKEADEARSTLSAAEAGDVDAMEKMTRYYDEGIGVAKDPAKAAKWRSKIEAVAAQKQLQAANGGSVEAMLQIAARYDAGLGVEKDPALAQTWRNKAEAVKSARLTEENSRATEERARRKESQIKSVVMFKDTKGWFEAGAKDGASGVISAIVLSPLFVPFSFLADLSALPGQSTDLNKINSEAALRPSTWGKPDSMIARATEGRATRNTLTVAAAR
ncbi:tetratricopeptide repeat protein, partial [Geoanaerobacter pelophilus]|uniref:tetratricopeptide repeat protein n=1 Tax=Geoanaerobacter pelophilus TaxID=60036 RepID=UPI00352FA843